MQFDSCISPRSLQICALCYHVNTGCFILFQRRGIQNCQLVLMVIRYPIGLPLMHGLDPKGTVVHGVQSM